MLFPSSGDRRRKMRSFARCLIVVATVVLGTTTYAADYCFNIAGNTLVLKAFSLPGKGVCKDARGFFRLSSDVWWLDGMACGSSDGTHVTFSQLAQPPGLVETFLYTVDTETLTGSLRQCVVDSGSGGSCVSGIALNKVPCSPAKVPVP
jgi:hypothetical protein